MRVTIRKATEPDESRWRSLWEAYLRLNGEEPSEELAGCNWTRIVDAVSSLNALVAEHDQAGVIGIANYVIHESLWTVGPVCYLSDLILEDQWRGLGVGKLFMD